ncbi:MULTISPECIES: hypothetical protein [unclassified Streptomyces]|uniref:hypothetical protein n=1 Tax=unclassified Streptomyces TaxID=2593676 RepID=UPI00081EA88B|nr:MULTISPECIES: hypothetical protein [unclassified Streptomyces]MYZ34644.1 hypothetical protein [Streptomyces sp. SID4917]SCF69010.1 hypothetical protein GA0115259_101072 [Streptomyces sp. MnatMP-M17]
MAEDDGTGRPVYPGLPVESAASGGGGGSADLNVDASELIKFKNRVDGLLTKLDESSAAPTEMAGGRVDRADLGTGFGEADELYGVYRRVHSELQNLSKGLAGQIEALGIAVDGSRKGYDNIDDEIKLRMQRISQDAQRDWDRREQERREERERTADSQSTDVRPGDSGGDSSGVTA